jgi:chitodextrinase
VAGLAANTSHAFQVQAFDAAGNVSSDGPATVVFEDTLSPTWPAGSALSAAIVSLSSATLAWTAAADNLGVVGYDVFANGLPLAHTNGSVLSATLIGLDPSVLYTFQVQAVDAAGNVSTQGPKAQLRLDVLPPSWPAGSTLTASLAGSSALGGVPKAADQKVRSFRSVSVRLVGKVVARS